MPLTPEDVSNKRFTTVRLREGYDMTEVDQFLDEVEAELTRLIKENETLRAQANGEPLPEASPAPAAPAAPAASAEVTDEPAAVEGSDAAATLAEPTLPADEPTAATAPPATESAVPARETLTVTTTAEASAAATRLLELAGRNADELVAEAEQEAQRIVSEARSDAERLEAETRQQRETLLGEIEQQRTQLTGEIDALRTFEREYRAELRTYFEDQLAALEGQGAGGVLGRSDRDPLDTPPESAEGGSDAATDGPGAGAADEGSDQQG